MINHSVGMMYDSQLGTIYHSLGMIFFSFLRFSCARQAELSLKFKILNFLRKILEVKRISFPENDIFFRVGNHTSFPRNDLSLSRPDCISMQFDLHGFF